jgi:hypothetical protein
MSRAPPAEGPPALPGLALRRNVRHGAGGLGARSELETDGRLGDAAYGLNDSLLRNKGE